MQKTQTNSTSSTTAAPVVLVIDDEPLVRTALRRTLAVSGFAVREADGGEVGLRMIEAGAPAAVVLDLNMPDMNGLDVLREIRAAHPDLPVVIYSGALDGKLLAVLEANGASAIVGKGGSGELMAALRRLAAT